MRWVARHPMSECVCVGGGGGGKNFVFDISRSPAPKLALVPKSR